jgi:hypothetical protein
MMTMSDDEKRAARARRIEELGPESLSRRLKDGRRMLKRCFRRASNHRAAIAFGAVCEPRDQL